MSTAQSTMSTSNASHYDEIKKKFNEVWGDAGLVSKSIVCYFYFFLHFFFLFLCTPLRNEQWAISKLYVDLINVRIFFIRVERESLFFQNKKKRGEIFFVNFFFGIARIFFFPPHRKYITYVCTSTCSRTRSRIFIFIFFSFLLRRLEELHVRRLNIFFIFILFGNEMIMQKKVNARHLLRKKKCRRGWKKNSRL